MTDLEWQLLPLEPPLQVPLLKVAVPKLATAHPGGLRNGGKGDIQRTGYIN